MMRSSHLDRASWAASRMRRSYTSRKSGEQRMRDTCDGLYPVSLAMSFCFRRGISTKGEQDRVVATLVTGIRAFWHRRLPFFRHVGFVNLLPSVCQGK